MHVAVNALGNPVRWLLSRGEVHDSQQGIALFKELFAAAVLAKQGYYVKKTVSYIGAGHTQVVMPPESCRIGRHLYNSVQRTQCTKGRSVVERKVGARKVGARFFSRVTQLRRMTTRYEQPDSNFLS